MQRELNVLALMKGEERFVFIYEDDDIESLIDKFKAWAGNDELSFSWFDAAIMTERAREQAASQSQTDNVVRRSTRILES